MFTHPVHHRHVYAVWLDSAILAIAELTRVGQEIYTSTFRPFEAYTTMAVLYLIMTLIIPRLSRYAEVKEALTPLSHLET